MRAARNLEEHQGETLSIHELYTLFEKMRETATKNIAPRTTWDVFLYTSDWYRRFVRGGMSMSVAIDRLLHRKEKASKDYMQLSNPPRENAFQIIDTNGKLHAIN